MTALAVKPALVEARWIIKILIAIIGGLFVMFFLIGWMSERQDTERMKACVAENTREWVNTDCTVYEPKDVKETP